VDLRDPEQFATAYRSHSRRVRAAAQRVLADVGAAEDVVQEVFVKLWLRPELFDAGRGSLAAFLCVMARSRALDRLRELRALEPATVESPVAALERREEREELRRALLRLPHAQREALTLAYGCEMSSGEIALQTQVGRATARSRLRLGLGKLRADLGPERQAA
jgi:RNA polymerase sigma-70 factor (ECF subfamily)